MSAFDLFSIGHSNIPAERFLALLRAAGADAIADVRSATVSRFFPWFTDKKLSALLEREGMIYLAYGETLGGRPRNAKLYRDGAADYEAMARMPEFAAGLDRLLSEAARRRVCLLCAEREPLDCHRCLLVGRALAARGATIGHILHDGSIEPHAATEQRSLAWAGEGEEGSATGDLFETGLGDRLAAAYRRRARAVAYRPQKNPKNR